MSVTRKILGFSDSKSVVVDVNQDALLFRHMINLSRKTRPLIYYIGAAKGDDPARRVFFERLCAHLYIKCHSLNLYAMEGEDPKFYFANADIIFIDGGVTRNLLALFKEWNVDAALRTSYKNGVLIAGASAGISVLFDWCITDSIKSNIKPMRGMNVLPGSVCAHYDTNIHRREVMTKLIESEPSARPGFCLSDQTACYFENESFKSGFTLDPSLGLLEYQGPKQTQFHNLKLLELPIKRGAVTNVSK